MCSTFAPLLTRKDTSSEKPQQLARERTLEPCVRIYRGQSFSWCAGDYQMTGTETFRGTSQMVSGCVPPSMHFFASSISFSSTAFLSLCCRTSGATRSDVIPKQPKCTHARRLPCQHNIWVKNMLTYQRVGESSPTNIYYLPSSVYAMLKVQDVNSTDFY